MNISEPCPDRFSRVGSDCYHFGSDAGREYDWKVASKQCKKIGGFLAETEGSQKIKELSSYILSKSHLLGKLFNSKNIIFMTCYINSLSVCISYRFLSRLCFGNKENAFLN